MNTEIKELAGISDEKIQNAPYLKFPFWALLLSLVSLAASVVLFVFSVSAWMNIAGGIAAVLILIFPLAWFRIAQKRKRLKDKVSAAKNLISEGSFDFLRAFVMDMKKNFGKDEEFMRELLVRIYSALMPKVIGNLDLDSHEKEILGILRRELKAYDEKEVLLNELLPYYLEKSVAFFQRTGTAGAPEGATVFPSDVESFVKTYIDFFSMKTDNVKPFLENIQKSIIRFASLLIREENVFGIKGFIEEREAIWKEDEEFMREMLIGIYSAMMPIVSEDHRIDAQEHEIIGFVLGKIKIYFGDDQSRMKNLSDEFLEKYTDNAFYDKGALSLAMNFIKDFVREFPVDNREALHFLDIVREHISIEKIETGELKKVEPSLKSIHEADRCFYEGTGELLMKSMSSANVESFRVKSQGQIFITAHTIQLAMKSLHILYLSELDSVEYLPLSRVLKLSMRGEMGEFYLRTPEDSIVLALIRELRSKNESER